MLAQPPEPQGIEAAVAARVVAAPTSSVPRDEGKHITRDFSHVRQEIGRIAAVSGFITISLVLTAIFLR